MAHDEKAQKKPTYKRSPKNLLLDRHFQLRYAGLLFGLAVVLSGVLGALLWRTSDTLITQSAKAVVSGQKAVDLGRQLAGESEKVSAVVKMNIVEEYKDSPELLATFQADQKKQDDKLAAQQAALEQQAQSLSAQANDLERQQKQLLWTLAIALVMLSLGMGAVGIVFTHKVAGPIFKMTRQLKRLGDGDMRVPEPLRKGDELTAFFGTFRETVERLRAQREDELAMLDDIREGVDDEALAGELDKLRSELERPLAT